MSKGEVERFVQDLRRSSQLHESIGQVFEGRVGLEELVGRAREAGYDIAVEDVKAHVAAELQSTSRRLTSRTAPELVATVTNGVSIAQVALIVPFVTGTLGTKRRAE